MTEVVKRSQLYLIIKHKGRISEHTLYGNELPFVWEFANPDDIYQYLNWNLSKIKNQWMISTREGAKPAPINLGQWYSIDGLKCRLWPNINFPDQGAAVWDKYQVQISPVWAATGWYLGSLGVGMVNEGSAVLSLTMVDQHSQKALDALNSLILLYNQSGLNDKNQVTANTMDFLTDRLESVERELKGVEGQVEMFKTKNQITDISTDAHNFLNLVTEIDRQKAIQETQISIINELEKELVLNQDNPKMVPSSLGLGEPTLLSLIQKHNDLLLAMERINSKAGPSNPALIDFENQVKEIRRSLIENVKNLKGSYILTLNDINRRNDQFNSRLKSMPSLEKNLVQITRDQSVKKELYLFLLQKREEAAVTMASAIPDSRNIEKPRSMGQIAPRRKNIWNMAWTLGVIIPILILVVIEFLNNKVGTHKEVEQKMRVPLLGDISFIKKLENPIPVAKGGRSLIAEQFRSIRTAISYTAIGKETKKILITSHRPGEGKSFTSLNLAASYALLHKKGGDP
jgi:hypothetical protein